MAGRNRDLVQRVVWSLTVNSWGHAGTGHRKEREMAFMRLLEKIKVLSDTQTLLCPVPE